MGVIDGRTWLEHLSPPECWKFLSLHPVSRIGVLVDSAPEICPVTHVVDPADDRVPYRPRQQAAGHRPQPVGVLRGRRAQSARPHRLDRSREGPGGGASSAEELRQAAGLPLRFWALGEKPHWIRIVPREVTGRRIHRSGRPEQW